MTTLAGGYPVYGQEVGIIMLDCRFPRPPGDIGNARSFPYPVRYEVLEGIAAARLTRQEDPAAVAALLAAAQRLERAGVRIILTSCGLFLRYQARLASAVRVPVATSAVLLLPFLAGLLPNERTIGVLTAEARALSPVLARAGWEAGGRVAVAGLEECPVFRQAILEPVPPFELDPQALRDEVIQAARQLVQQHPTVGALLVECTNLSPYSPALRAATGLPVFDVMDLALLLHGAACERGPNRKMGMIE